LSGSGFEGGVFSPAIPEGRARAVLQVESPYLAAVVDESRTERLPMAGTALELGGASGKMLFCRHPAHEGVTFYSEAPGFVDALWAGGDEGIRAQLQALWHRRKRAKWHVAGWAGVGVLALVAAFYTLSALADGAVAVIPYSADEAVGELARDHMGPQQLGGAVIEAPVAEQAIGVIVNALDDHLSLEGVSFEIRVVRSDLVNAFALPGGYITVFTGLIDKSASYEELAAVLAHEIAHVTLRHGITRIVQSLGVVGGLQIVFGDVGGLLGAAEELFTIAAINGYSRGHESEADEEGVRMMHAAGIDPSAAARFFRALKNSEEGSALPDALAWVSTHPDHDERIEAIEAQVSALGPVRERRLDIDWKAVQASLVTAQDEKKSDEDHPDEEG
jgi:Zn-dependent protease with chaperone function